VVAVEADEARTDVATEFVVKAVEIGVSVGVVGFDVEELSV